MLRLYTSLFMITTVLLDVCCAKMFLYPGTFSFHLLQDRQKFSVMMIHPYHRPVRKFNATRTVCLPREGLCVQKGCATCRDTRCTTSWENLRTPSFWCYSSKLQVCSHPLLLATIVYRSDGNKLFALVHWDAYSGYVDWYCFRRLCVTSARYNVRDDTVLFVLHLNLIHVKYSLNFIFKWYETN
jgi:hypothetical protein